MDNFSAAFRRKYLARLAKVRAKRRVDVFFYGAILDTEPLACHGNVGILNNRKTVRPFARYVVASSAVHN